MTTMPSQRILVGVRAGPWTDTALLGCLLACAIALCGVAVVQTGASPARLLTLLLLAPVLEEAVFRAGLQDMLTRQGLAMSPVSAALWTALAFGLVHVLAHREASAFFVVGPAFAIGLVYTRWHRLRWCVLAHAGMNALWLVIAPRVPWTTG